MFETFKQCWTLVALRLQTERSGFALTTEQSAAAAAAATAATLLPTNTAAAAASSGPRLWRVLHTLVFTEFWLCGLCRFLNDALLVAGTILIKFIVR